MIVNAKYQKEKGCEFRISDSGFQIRPFHKLYKNMADGK